MSKDHLEGVSGDVVRHLLGDDALGFVFPVDGGALLVDPPAPREESVAAAFAKAPELGARRLAKLKPPFRGAFARRVHADADVEIGEWTRVIIVPERSGGWFAESGSVVWLSEDHATYGFGVVVTRDEIVPGESGAEARVVARPDAESGSFIGVARRVAQSFAAVERLARIERGVVVEELQTSNAPDAPGLEAVLDAHRVARIKTLCDLIARRVRTDDRPSLARELEGLAARALELDGDDPAARYARALTIDALQGSAAAAEFVLKAGVIPPSGDASRLVVGWLIEHGPREAALRVAEAVAERNAADADCVALVREAQDDPVGAHAAYSRALAAEGLTIHDAERLRQGRAAAAVKTKQFQRALEDLDGLPAVDGVVLLRAKSLVGLERLHEAKQLLRAAGADRSGATAELAALLRAVEAKAALSPPRRRPFVADD